MKKSVLLIVSLAILFSSVASCKKKITTPDQPTALNPVTSGNPNVVVNTGNLRLFVIDTAKVNTIMPNGSSETTILNRMVNTSSYISSFSINNDNSKFAYVDNQGAFTTIFTPVNTVRVSNSNGTADVAIYTAPANTNSVTNQIGFVKFGASKIYFATAVQTLQGAFLSTIAKLSSCNFDGTGLVAENLQGDLYNTDVTTDGRYLASNTALPYTPAIQIIDRTGDGGAGSVIFQENLPNGNTSKPVFAYDNTFAYFAFAETQSIKIRIINMTTKTAETKIIATGFTPTSFYISLSVGSDKNRGVVTVDPFSSAPTKSYVFDLTSGVSTNFNNNDNTVQVVKAF